MKKQLNIDGIRSELSGGSAFFPNYQGESSPAPDEELSTTMTEPVRLTQQAEHHLPERPNAPTPVRSNSKRIITRNSFEIYEDQMDSLRERSYKEKRAGQVGSMSAMVRKAIDKYLIEEPLET